MCDLNKETLLDVGFVDVAAWRLAKDSIDYKLDGERAQANALLLEEPNSLYAFVREEAVLYIGKTTRSVRRRFFGYRTPGAGQTTNLGCNAKIKQALKAGAAIRILVFAPISDLRYRDFEINLAAALEDSLIKAFKPPWNGGDKGKPITEDAEREKAEEPLQGLSSAEDPASTNPEPSLPSSAGVAFKITLGQAYYNQGIINPGKDVSDHLGQDGDPIKILFDDGTEPVLSNINRKANSNGSVRVVGRNRQIADWFQRHFKPGDVVDARVLDPNRIQLMSRRN